MTSGSTLDTAEKEVVRQEVDILAPNHEKDFAKTFTLLDQECVEAARKSGKIPEEYALKVPEEETERKKFLVALKEEFRAHLATELNEAEVKFIMEALELIIPSVNSSGFASALRRRVSASDGLFQGSLLEAMISIAGTQENLKNAEKTIEAVYRLCRSVVPATGAKGKGLCAPKTLPAKEYGEILGARIVHNDDKSKVEGTLKQNGALLMKVKEKFAGVDGAEGKIDAGTTALMRNYDRCETENGLYPRDLNFIGAQLVGVFFKKINALDPGDESALENLLSEIKEAKTLEQIMETLGIKNIAHVKPKEGEGIDATCRFLDEELGMMFPFALQEIEALKYALLEKLETVTKADEMRTVILYPSYFLEFFDRIAAHLEKPEDSEGENDREALIKERMTVIAKRMKEASDEKAFKKVLQEAFN